MKVVEKVIECFVVLLTFKYIVNGCTHLKHQRQKIPKKPGGNDNGITFITTEVVIPLVNTWITFEIDRAYAKNPDEAKENKKRATELVKGITEKIVDRIDYWGNRLSTSIEEVKFEFRKQIDQLRFDMQYREYSKFLSDIDVLYEKFSHFKARYKEFNNKNIDDLLIREGIVRVRYTLTAIQNYVFHSDDFNKGVAQSLYQVAKISSSSFLRTILFKFYVGHIAALLKGWIAGTFALDLVRVYDGYNHTTEQSRLTDKVNNYIQKTTDTIVEMLDRHENLKFVSPSKYVRLYDNDKPNEYFMLIQDIQGNIQENKVISGISFIPHLLNQKDNSFVVIRCQYATLLPNGEINAETKEWSALPKSRDNVIETTEGFYFTEIMPNEPDYVMTAIRFVRKDEKRSCFEATFHQFSMETGKLMEDTFYRKNNCDVIDNEKFQRQGTSPAIIKNIYIQGGPIEFEMSPITGISFYIDPESKTDTIKVHPRYRSINYKHFMTLTNSKIEGIVDMSEDEPQTI